MHFDPASTVFASALMRAAGPLAPEGADLEAPDLALPSPDIDLDAFMSTNTALDALAEIQRSVARIESSQVLQGRQIDRVVEELDHVQARSHDHSKRLARLARRPGILSFLF